jgi:hypothetical protein
VSFHTLGLHWVEAVKGTKSNPKFTDHSSANTQYPSVFFHRSIQLIALPFHCKLDNLKKYWREIQDYAY